MGIEVPDIIPPSTFSNSNLRLDTYQTQEAKSKKPVVLHEFEQELLSSHKMNAMTPSGLGTQPSHLRKRNLMASKKSSTLL